MAVLEVNVRSKELFRTVPMYVILPVDKMTDEPYESKPFKTLYLLHGLEGNYTDWLYGTRIQEWAEERNLAVVMPSGDNSFYVDNPVSRNGKFIGQEILELTRRMFPLSRKREDTFIAGLSMGGFGAIRNGLVYHENYGYVAGLSSALHLFEVPFDMPGRNLRAEDEAFGNIEEAAKTDKNPRIALENLKKEHEANPAAPLPKIYLSCGTEDHLVVIARLYRDLLRDAGLDVTYYEGPGVHNWDFWNQEIQKVLDWLPLDEKSAVGGSGNPNAK